jgi:hypothetical protein
LDDGVVTMWINITVKIKSPDFITEEFFSSSDFKTGRDGVAYMNKQNSFYNN